MQGCLKPVQVLIPSGSLLDPSETAAVVGGNVLTCQRIVDVIFRAFETCAASQGCMNNVTFGDANVGYYETVAGGAGAVSGCGYDYWTLSASIARCIFFINSYTVQVRNVKYVRCIDYVYGIRLYNCINCCFAGSRMGRAQRCTLSHDQHKDHRSRDTRKKVQNTAH